MAVCSVQTELMKRCKFVLAGALNRMRNRLLALVYDAWARWLQREQETQEILRGCAMRFANRLTSMVWEAWHGFLEQRKRTRAIAARAADANASPSASALARAC